MSLLRIENSVDFADSVDFITDQGFFKMDESGKIVSLGMFSFENQINSVDSIRSTP